MPEASVPAERDPRAAAEECLARTNGQCETCRRELASGSGDPTARYASWESPNRQG